MRSRWTLCATELFYTHSLRVGCHIPKLEASVILQSIIRSTATVWHQQSSCIVKNAGSEQILWIENVVNEVPLKIMTWFHPPPQVIVAFDGTWFFIVFCPIHLQTDTHHNYYYIKTLFQPRWFALFITLGLDIENLTATIVDKAARSAVKEELQKDESAIPFSEATQSDMDSISARIGFQVSEAEAVDVQSTPFRPFIWGKRSEYEGTPLAMEHLEEHLKKQNPDLLMSGKYKLVDVRENVVQWSQ